MKELINIQNNLKAPKGQFNKFGNYKYRSCEDILESVKPLLFVEKCTLTISDDMLCYDGRFYIKAIVTLANSAGESVQVSAFAREEEVKKGMDAAQITGAASSYARKYALNGLFCIDDTRDPDATNTHGKEAGKVNPGADPIVSSKESLDEIIGYVNNAQSRDELNILYNSYPQHKSDPIFVKAFKEAAVKFPKS